VNASGRRDICARAPAGKNHASLVERIERGVVSPRIFSLSHDRRGGMQAMRRERHDDSIRRAGKAPCNVQIFKPDQPLSPCRTGA